MKLLSYHIQNNQGLSKGYQPKPKAEVDTPTLTLIILDITEPNLITVLLCTEQKILKSYFWFFTDGNTKHANLT